MQVLACLCAAAAAFGVLQALAGLWAVRRFLARPRPDSHALPPVTLLKPLCGDEPGLEAALASFCAQDYPDFQIVFGVQDESDPALATARRLQARYERLDIAVVIDPTMHGANRKICNLINMLPRAAHDILVFADSDLHVRPDYLRRVVATLLQPGVGLVTTLSLGAPANVSLAARLGAAHLTCSFLPGVLLGAAATRQDCLGTTVAIGRETLERIGGLHSVVGNLADDNVLGRRVRAGGLAVRLADTIARAQVRETTLAELWRHELRWACTIRAIIPITFAAAALQYPILWAALAALFAGGAPWAVAWFAACWIGRAAIACVILRCLDAPKIPALSAILPLRDVLSVAETAASYVTRRVVWRGHMLRVDAATLAPIARYLPEMAPDPRMIETRFSDLVAVEHAPLADSLGAPSAA